MTNDPLNDNQSEMKMHKKAICRIIMHHRDIAEKRVARLYEIVLRRYKAGARV